MVETDVMARENKKIPEDFIPDPILSEQVKIRFSTGDMPCASAFKASDELNISTRTLGLYADVLDIRLSTCQIGLFGHGKGVKLIKTLDRVDSALEKDIRERTTDGVIACKDVFDLARAHKTSKVDVGSACQTLGIKVKHCRFGAF